MARKKAQRDAPSQRQLRVSETLRHSVADLFLRGDVGDPSLYEVSMTVSAVSVSPDLRNAVFYVSVLGEKSELELAWIESALARAAGTVRNHIARTVSLRYVPHVRLILDRTGTPDSQLAAIFERADVRRDVAAPSGTDPESDADAGPAGEEEDTAHGA